MRKTKAYKSHQEPESVELLAEYRFNYRNARSNRFAKMMEGAQRVILLDPDVAGVFTTRESVNKALRALISAMPQSYKKPSRK